MNPRTAAEIALGVAGVWLIASRIPDIVLTSAFSPVDSGGLLRWLGPLQLAVVAACGVGLILLRRRLAAWLVPGSQPDLTGSIPGLQAAAFSVVGVVLLARGLSELLAQLALAASGPGRTVLPAFATPLAQIAVGLAVFFGARGLVAMWRSRAAGQRGE
jgi:hypothetical protein